MQPDSRRTGPFVGGVLATLTVLLLATTATAQDRSPTGRQAMSDLAYVLGQSHALRQACQGESDQYWRSRMLQLMEIEAPDQGLKARLSRAFNSGYQSAQAGFPACDDGARAEAGRTAARGRALADRLASP